MSSVIGKSFKFIRVLNGRLSFNSAKSFNNSRRLIKLYDCSKNGKVEYATAAHKYLTNSEQSIKNDFAASSYNENITTIDDALSRFDFQIQRYGRILGKNLVNAFSMVTHKEMTSSTHGLYLLRSCKYCYSEHPSKRIELVKQIWNRYQELGIQFDVRHYNALLDVHISNDLEFDPVEILNSMEENKIEPNRATYILVMKKYCESGDINGASEILEHMKEKGLPANEDVFNNLIQGHVKNNDFDGAKEIIDVMRSSNLQPNENTYTILACGYAAAGNKDEMMKCLQNEAINSEINALSCLKVVESLASSENHQHIDNVLSMIKHPENFQQEFINSAIELIHKGFIEIAHKLVVSSYTPQYEQGILIFIKQIVKVGRPVSEILEFCTQLHKGNFSSMIYLSASKAAIESGRHDCIVPIFKKMGEQGQFIRASNFWPLFASLKNEKSSDGMWLVLKQMRDVGVPVDFNTYYEILFPILGTPDPNTVIQNVEKSGQSKEVAADALFLHYCDLGRIDYAHKLTEIIPVHLTDKLNIEEFVNMYKGLNSDAVEKYFKVLKYMFVDENYLLAHGDVQGRLLAELISKQPRVLEILLRKYQDLSFSSKTMRFCELVLREMRPFKEYLMLLNRLHNLRQDRYDKQDLSIEEEEKQIKYLQKQKADCKPFLTRRLRYHIMAKNLSRVSELLAISDELNVTFSPLLHSNLLALYCLASDIEKATNQYHYMKTNFPTFVIDLAKVLDYVTLLVKYQKLDESIEVLKSVKEPYIYVQKDSIEKKIKLFSSALSTIPNSEFARTMQELILPISKEFLFEKGFINSMLSLHLKRDDLSAAYEEFRNYVKTFHTPSGLNMFLKKCININAKDMLQKVIDLTIGCVGKSYALLELALAFIETRNYDRASAVIESLKQEASPKDVEDICLRLRSLNKISDLENFIRVTKPLNHENREILYGLAIKAYVVKKDFNKATQLFGELKKEVGEPSHKIVSLMQELLEKNNKPIPLSSLPKSSPDNSQESIEATKTFMKHLEDSNAEAALNELKDMKKGYIRTLSIKTLTDLIDLCLEQKSIGDLSQNVLLMSYILDNMKDVFQPLLEKYSMDGDVDKFMEISRFFPDFSLININFNSYVCKAFISSNKQEELLSHLEQRYDKKNKLFSMAAFEELLKYPEYENRVYNLAENYYNSKFTFPMSVIWAYYFSKENYEKADTIFQKFSIGVEKADNLVIRAIKQNENVNLAQKYVTMVKSLNVRNRLKERAFGAALDILVLKGMNDEAAALVQESEKFGLQLHKYNLSILITLKRNLEKENKSVPFYLPDDVLSQSSSESDKE